MKGFDGAVTGSHDSAPIRTFRPCKSFYHRALFNGKYHAPVLKVRLSYV